MSQQHKKWTNFFKVQKKSSKEYLLISMLSIFPYPFASLDLHYLNFGKIFLSNAGFFFCRYNFDPVNDKPLSGRFEWVKLNR